MASQGAVDFVAGDIDRPRVSPNTPLTAAFALTTTAAAREFVGCALVASRLASANRSLHTPTAAGVAGLARVTMIGA